MRKRVSEKRLVDVLVAHLRKGHEVAREVVHYEKRIDVVALNRSSQVVAIEAKTENWARAISQATVNLSAAEHSYIAIYAPNAHRVPAELLEERGIGLFAVGATWGDVVVLNEPSPSPYVNRLAEDRIRKSVLGRGRL